jgi:hypothetical protein
MKNLVRWLFGTRKQQLDIPVVISSSNHFDEDHNNWCKVFDDMLESPYIDVTSIRECDRIAILSWLSSNYHSPVKRVNPNY